uniref:Uncharacterized protein n=1 Tax=Rhizophora mucronata TaxID=61149 RepID=A0A2P2J1J0_RHIMU
MKPKICIKCSNVHRIIQPPNPYHLTTNHLSTISSPPTLSQLGSFLLSVIYTQIQDFPQPLNSGSNIIFFQKQPTEHNGEPSL